MKIKVLETVRDVDCRKCCSMSKGIVKLLACPGKEERNFISVLTVLLLPAKV